MSLIQCQWIWTQPSGTFKLIQFFRGGAREWWKIFSSARWFPNKWWPLHFYIACTWSWWFLYSCHIVKSHVSVWMKVRNAHCSYSQFFIVFSLLVVVKVKLQKVAFYGGPMVLLLQDYALQIRRLQPSHAAMLPPRGPRLPDHMAATLPADQITQILCAETPLLPTSFSPRPSRIQVFKS